MVRSAPRLCCAPCAQGTRAVLELTLQQRETLGSPNLPSVSPQSKTHFMHPAVHSSAATALISSHKQPHMLYHISETKGSLGMNPISSLKFPSLQNTEVLSCLASICLKGSWKNLSILLSPI